MSSVGPAGEDVESFSSPSWLQDEQIGGGTEGGGGGGDGGNRKAGNAKIKGE